MTSDDTLSGLRALDAYTIADAARRAGVGAVCDALRPQTRTSRFVGRALTVRVRYEPHASIPLASYGLAAVLDRVQAGDVLVVDLGALPLTAMGEIVARILTRKGAAAAVVNGCVRDIEDIEETGLPVFAVATSITTIAGHGYLTGVGEPVHVHGVRIATGDVVAGCRGGLVVVPAEDAQSVLEIGMEIAESDRRVHEGLAHGEPLEEVWKRSKSFPSGVGR